MLASVAVTQTTVTLLSMIIMVKTIQGAIFQLSMRYEHLYRVLLFLTHCVSVVLTHQTYPPGFKKKVETIKECLSSLPSLPVN